MAIGNTTPIKLFFHSVYITLLLASCHSNSGVHDIGAVQQAKFPLEGITIDELRQKLQNGQYTSRQITQMYLDRIARIDKDGPDLNAVIEINPDALSIADALDKERANHNIRGPLHGIPVLIKDNIDTGDNMQTTAGSIALVGNKPSKDAFVIQELREAGAIILGKTNLSEWANFRSPNSISGWSSRGGQTKNPYLLDHTPCGSSSGSAVAVAADLCMVAVGTATDGSISCPSSMNGIVGIRPTVGLVSRTGLIPISKTLDTPGPMARTVKDAAILLGAMTEYDPLDPAADKVSGMRKQDYTQYLDTNALMGKRIGIEKSMLLANDGIGQLLHRAIDQMKRKGAVIVEVEFENKYYSLLNAEHEIMQYEFKDGINKYLVSSNAPVKSLEEIIRYNYQNRLIMMPYFKQELLEQAETRKGLDSKEYKQALSKLLTMRTFLDNLMDQHHLDVLCGVGNGATGPGALARNPSMTVPMGLVDELPVGITFVGEPYKEPTLVAIAYAYEQASKNRTAPKFLYTVKSFF